MVTDGAVMSQRTWHSCWRRPLAVCTVCSQKLFYRCDRRGYRATDGGVIMYCGMLRVVTNVSGLLQMFWYVQLGQLFLA